MPLPSPDIPSLAHLLDKKLENRPLLSDKKQPLISMPSDSNIVRATILLPLTGVNKSVGNYA